MKEILIGVMASLFFAVTFILNRSMELSGGSWIWSSSLRFIFMVPFLLIIVLARNNFKPLLLGMLKQPYSWLCWSFVGFGLFYAPITYAAAYGPAWLVAGTWQLTIVAGTLLVPLFFDTIETKEGPIKTRKKIPMGALGISFIILLGVILIQWQKANSLTLNELWVGILPVVVAAFAYPLGNRKMMEVCGGRLDVFQRVLGMTLASLPFWLILSTYGYVQIGGPSLDQVIQSFIIAVCSGIIATTLFFIATDRVREHPGKLASVEATQSTQVLFVMIGEVSLLSSPLPSEWAMVGILVIILGVLLHSYYAKTVKQNKPPILRGEKHNV